MKGFYGDVRYVAHESSPGDEPADQKPVTDEQYGILKIGDDSRPKEQIISTIANRHPMELEERVDTLDKPLIIECASPGWQPDVWSPEDAYSETLPPNYSEVGEMYSMNRIHVTGPLLDRNSE